MKKWIGTLLTALFMTLIIAETGVVSISAAADKTGTTSDGYSYKISAKTGTVEITGYKGKEKELVLPETIGGKKVKKIGEKAFSKNNNIVSVKVSDNVENIALDAFEGCDNLCTIELGKNVKEIGDVEKDSSQISWIIGYDCDEMIMYIGKNFESFEVASENQVYYAEDGVLFRNRVNRYGENKKVLIHYPEGKEAEKYMLPDGINYIYLDTFEYAQMKTLVIPGSVEYIDTIEFPSWNPSEKLEEYIVDETNERYFAQDGVLFERDVEMLNGSVGWEIIQYPAEKRDISYTIPKEVVEIDRGAFKGQKYLENVTIPDTVEYIRQEAFCQMENLKSAYIGAKIIDVRAFYECKNLTDVTLGKRVKQLREEAFSKTALTSLVLPEKVKIVKTMEIPTLKKLEVRNSVTDLRNISGYINQLVIYGYEGSTAEEYAKQNGYRFKLIGEEETPDEGLNESTINKDTVQLSKTSYIYNGKAQKPKVVVKDKFGNTIDRKYYKVTYKNNKNVGLATVKIQLKGSYTGTIKTTFSIKPPVSSITKTEKTENGFRVKWKGVKASQIDGYEIQYSTDNKFKKENIKRVFVNQSNAVKTNIKAGKKEKQYYVRIRSYKVVSKDGKAEKLYSKWSEKKTVKN